MKKLFYRIYRLLSYTSYIKNLEKRCLKSNFAPFDIIIPKINQNFEWNNRTIKIAENWLNGKRGQELFT